MERWIDAKDAADWLGISLLDLYERIDAGGLPAFWFGSALRLKASDVEAAGDYKEVEEGEISARIKRDDLPEFSALDLVEDAMVRRPFLRSLKWLLPLVLGVVLVVTIGIFSAARPEWVDPIDFTSVTRPLFGAGVAAAVPVGMLVTVSLVLPARQWVRLRRILGGRFIGLLVLSAVVSMILFFSLAYWLLGQFRPEAFSERLSKLDSIYFTVTAFTTTGFGDVHAIGRAARTLVAGQMAYGFVIISVLVTIVLNRGIGRDGN